MERNINLVCARRPYRRLTTAREKVAYLAAECGNQFAEIAAVTDTPETTVRRWIQIPETSLRSGRKTLLTEAEEAELIQKITELARTNALTRRDLCYQVLLITFSSTIFI